MLYAQRIHELNVVKQRFGLEDYEADYFVYLGMKEVNREHWVSEGAHLSGDAA
jgi:hypothetical protein